MRLTFFAFFPLCVIYVKKVLKKICALKIKYLNILKGFETPHLQHHFLAVGSNQQPFWENVE